MYKCPVCGKEYENIADLIRCLAKDEKIESEKKAAAEKEALNKKKKAKKAAIDKIEDKIKVLSEEVKEYVKNYNELVKEYNSICDSPSETLPTYACSLSTKKIDTVNIKMKDLSNLFNEIPYWF